MRERGGCRLDYEVVGGNGVLTPGFSSRGNVILAFPLGADGKPTSRRVWAKMPGPDSMDRDGVGRVWCASYTESALYVWSPAGKLLRKFTISTEGATNVAFGPHGSYRVYVTSGQGCVNVLRIDPKDPLAEGLP